MRETRGKLNEGIKRKGKQNGKEIKMDRTDEGKKSESLQRLIQ